MAFLTVLKSRATTPSAILADWDSYLAQRQAEQENAKAGTDAKLVTVETDVRDVQRRIENALLRGELPDQADIDYREPNFPAMVAQYAIEAVREHRDALRRGLGDRDKHLDCIAAWMLVAQVGKTARGTREMLGKLVATAEKRSVDLVTAARKARKQTRRAA